MLPLFALAIFVSAALLFVVQPMSGKVLLPLLGGSPAVWNTCMVFFQAVLLLGYFYAHLTTTKLSRKWQTLVHLGLVIIAGATLPMPILVGEPGDADPVMWVIRTLGVTVGLPFFVVSTSGPLLQRWFSTTGHAAAKDPYFLYAASNAGSVVGLLAYPLVLEPLLTRREQSIVWTVGFAALGVLVAACGVRMLGAGVQETSQVAAKPEVKAPLTGALRLLWLALSFGPSSLMLGVTQHVSTDIAAIPLLWIIPLGLYLISFILAFSQKWRLSAAAWGRMLPVGIVAVMVAMLSGARSPIGVLLFVHFATFFIAAMMCHTRLADLRPDPSRLTEFYLFMSLGGVLGGLLNSVVAPLVFSTMMEYPLVLGLLALLRPQILTELNVSRSRVVAWAIGLGVAAMLLLILLNVDAAINDKRIVGDLASKSWRAGLPALLCIAVLLKRGSVRFAASATFLLTATTYIGEGGTLLFQTRTFFGEHRVISTSNHAWHRLSHGTTLHGLQPREPEDPFGPGPVMSAEDRVKMLFADNAAVERMGGRIKYRQLIPTTYYHTSGPIGAVMKMLIDRGQLRRAGFVGLGAGTLAAYAVPNARFTYFEIDPAVIRIAGDRSLFSYISDAARDTSVKIGYELGDGRLKIRDTKEGPFDLIVLDAFSSDSIPVHLLTKEAVEIYLSKLEAGGIIAFHISNRYFDLTNPLQRIASELGLKAYRANDDVSTTYLDEQEGKKTSLWLMMVRKEEDFMPLAHLPKWDRLGKIDSFPLWTDDYSNLLGVMVKWW
ncbi:MAG: hypothetical protein JSR77_15430 [Planctomycetes bacterium]|nr:hypothetical protein [Planctomycetota bacterium]